MKLLFIRHGDPDYTIDSLTEKGWKEAELLSYKLEKVKMDYCYVSPLGRAKDTAAATLQKTGMKATECKWLQEFAPRIQRPDRKGERTIAWDWLPEDWTKQDDFYSFSGWTNHDVFQEADIRAEYEWVTGEFEKLLASHGYVKKGRVFEVKEANNDTLVFFCHFGLQCILLGYLFEISPMIMWHHFCAAPTSVTTVVTEERRENTAIFRAVSFGDISHLYAMDEPPAFAARFCECYKNTEERHD